MLGDLPDGSTVVVDGLVARAHPAAFVGATARLRLAWCCSLPSADAVERAVLPAAAAVVTPSRWGRERVIAQHGLPPDRVHVARPGTDPAPLAPGTAGGGALLCVGVVAPHKGHDVLLDALALVADAPWRLPCAGSLERNPAFVARLRRHPQAGRVTFAGPLAGAELERAYAAADVLVHPSRGEMYGLVLGEALAHGLPAIASDVGGVREAVPGAGGCSCRRGTRRRSRPPCAAGWPRRAARRLRRDAELRRSSQPSWAATARAVAAAGVPLER